MHNSMIGITIMSPIGMTLMTMEMGLSIYSISIGIVISITMQYSIKSMDLFTETMVQTMLTLI